MLQIKNTLGGGKSNAPYAWAKYEVIPDEILTNPSIDLSYVQSSGRINITGASFDLSFLPSVTNSNGLSLNGTDNEKQVVDFFTGFQIATNQYNLDLYNDVLTFYFESGALTITEFHNDTDGTWFTVAVIGTYSAFEKTLPFTGEKIGRRSYHNFIEYITDKSLTKYPNGEVHTDGFFYRYAPEGLYAWNKHPINQLRGRMYSEVNSSDYSSTYGSAVIYDGKIHILKSTVHTAYDGNSRTKISDIPYSCTYGDAVVYHNKIHVLSGGESSGARKYHQVWDGTSWEQKNLFPAEMFYYGSLVVYNDQIHAFGSENSNYHYVWNEDTDTWTKLDNIPYYFYNGTAVVYNNEVHLIGSKHSYYYNYHYKWDGANWTSVSTLPSSTYGARAVVIDGKIHLLGNNYNSSYCKQYLIYDGNSWVTSDDLPYNFYVSPVVVYNNEIYCCGSQESPSNLMIYKVYGDYTEVDESFVYIVSDKETAYPDGGEKGGYWYEKVVEGIDLSALGMTKCETGSFTLASDYYTVTFNHTLGIKPKAVIINENAGVTGSKIINTYLASGTRSAYTYNARAGSGVSTNNTLDISTVEIGADNTNYKFKGGVEYHYALFA